MTACGFGGGGGHRSTITEKYYSRMEVHAEQSKYLEEGDKQAGDVFR